MTESPLHLALLSNARGEFTGYLMEPAKGKSLQANVFLSKMVIQRHFPRWTRKSLALLCRTILEKILYLCPVGMVNHTAPELHGKDYRTYLRTFNHEHFAVATPVFMILFPGNESNRKTPPGPWRFLWSHLPYKLKEVFYQTFLPSGSHRSKRTCRMTTPRSCIVRHLKSMFLRGLVKKLKPHSGK